jgi:hypothetical protein
LNYFYQALTLVELGKIPEAHECMRECMVNPLLEGEKNELCVSIWSILMAHDGQIKNALKLLKFSIKNFIGFSPLTHLVKSSIELTMHI